MAIDKSKYTEAVERGLELAQIAGKMIEENPIVELVREPSLSCVFYRRIGWKPEDYTNWTYENHEKGFALVTPTKYKNGEILDSFERFLEC